MSAATVVLVPAVGPLLDPQGAGTSDTCSRTGFQVASAVPLARWAVGVVGIVLAPVLLRGPGLGHDHLARRAPRTPEGERRELGDAGGGGSRPDRDVA